MARVIDAGDGGSGSTSNTRPVVQNPSMVGGTPTTIQVTYQPPVLNIPEPPRYTPPVVAYTGATAAPAPTPTPTPTPTYTTPTVAYTGSPAQTYTPPTPTYTRPTSYYTGGYNQPTYTAPTPTYTRPVTQNPSMVGGTPTTIQQTVEPVYQTPVPDPPAPDASKAWLQDWRAPVVQASNPTPTTSSRDVSYYAPPSNPSTVGGTPTASNAANYFPQAGVQSTPPQLANASYPPVSAAPSSIPLASASIPLASAIKWGGVPDLVEASTSALKDAWTSTPGYIAAKARSEERHSENVHEQDFEALPGFTGSGETWGEAAKTVGLEALDNALTANRNFQRIPGIGAKVETIQDYGMDIISYVFEAPAQAVITEEIPFTGGSLGEVYSAGIEGVSAFMGSAGFMWNAVGGVEAAADTFSSELTEASKVRANIYSLAPSRNDPERLALLSIPSGPTKTMMAAQAVANQSGDVAALRESAVKLFHQANNLANGVPPQVRQEMQYEAARQFADAGRLENKSALDLVEENQNIWRQLGAEILLDPLQLVSPVSKILKVDKASRIAKATDKTLAVSTRDELVKAVKTLDTDKVLTGSKANTWADNVNPFRQTPQTRALNDTATLYKTFGTVFGAVQNTADARLLMDTLIRRPQALIDGISGLTSPKFLKEVGASGAYQFGETAIAAADLTGAGLTKFQKNVRGKSGALDTLVAAKTELLNLKSLETRKFNVIDFVAEATNAVHKVAGEVHGVKKANKLEQLHGVQLSLMSEAWLTMKPGFWVRNALSASGHLAADGALTFRKSSDLSDSLLRKTGGLQPTARLAEAADDLAIGRPTFGISSEVGRQDMSMFRLAKYFKKAKPSKLNVVAGLSELGGDVAFGNKAIAGRIPVGEQNFYNRAYVVPFERVFAKGWGKVVDDNLFPALNELGLPPVAVQNIVDSAKEAAVHGGRGEVMTAIRNTIQSNGAGVNLKKYGIKDPSLSKEGYDHLMKGIGEIDNPEDLLAHIDEVFDGEATVYDALLDEAPPQMGRHQWSDLDGTQDSAEIVDSFVRAAKESGGDIEAAKATGQQMAQQIDESIRFAMDTLREEAVRGGMGAMNAALDGFATIMEKRRTMRGDLQDLVSRAIDPDDIDYKWEQYFETANGTYGEFPQFIQDATDKIRLGIQKGDVPERSKAWNMMERQALRHDEEIDALRALAPDIQGAAGDGERMKAVIDANRAYTDSYLAQTYAAFTRYPTQDSLDHVFSMEMDLNRLGSRTASKVAKERDKLLDQVREVFEGGRTWNDSDSKALDAFYIYRNEAWQDLADIQAGRMSVAKYDLVSEGYRAEVVSQITFRVGDEKYRIYEQITPNLYLTSGPDGGLKPFKAADIPEDVRDAYATATSRLGEDIGKQIDEIALDVPIEIDPADSRKLNRATRPYDNNPAFDLDGDTDLYQSIREVNGGRRSAGGNWAPEMGEIADFNRGQQERARRLLKENVDDILNPAGDEIPEVMKLRAIDSVSKLGPAWDDVVEASKLQAQKAADFAMLDFSQRSNMDKWISLLAPYHFWHTRSRWNWLDRTMTKPQVLSRYQSVNSAVEQENESKDLPLRMEGTVPISGTDLRMENPLRYIIPYDMYGVNEWADPDGAQNGFSRWMQTQSMFGFGIYPAYQAAVNYATGDKEAQAEMDMGDFVPQYRLLGTAYQSVTGERLPGAGDRWDFYRMARDLSVKAQSGDISPTMAQWGQDIAYQIMNDVGALPEQPLEAQKVYEQAAKDAGIDRMWAVAGAYIAGLGIYPYTEAESVLMEKSQRYQELGYDSFGNPLGSRAAKKEHLEQNPEVSSWWSRYSLAPDSAADRPGVRAATTEYWGKVGPLFDDMRDTVADYLYDNPDAERGDVNDLKSGFWDKINGLYEKYPSAEHKIGDSDEDSTGGVTGANPIERAQDLIESVLAYEPMPRPTAPDEEASDSDRQTYYEQLHKYQTARLDYVEGILNQHIEMAEAGFPNLVDEMSSVMVEGRYAADLLRAYNLRYASDVEKMWSEQVSIADEWRSDVFRRIDTEAPLLFGEDILDINASYPTEAKGNTKEEIAAWFESTTTGGDFERLKQFWDWRSGTLNEYEALFGSDVKAIADSYPSDAKGGTAQDRKEWYAEQKFSGDMERVQAYWDWREGAFASVATESPKLFGKDIFEVADDFPSKAKGFSDEDRGRWIRANTENGTYDRLKAFWAFRNDVWGSDVPEFDDDIARPFGSGRDPIGGPGAVPTESYFKLSQFASDPSVAAQIKAWSSQPNGMLQEYSESNPGMGGVMTPGVNLRPRQSFEEQSLTLPPMTPQEQLLYADLPPEWVEKVREANLLRVQSEYEAQAAESGPIPSGTGIGQSSKPSTKREYTTNGRSNYSGRTNYRGRASTGRTYTTSRNNGYSSQGSYQSVPEFDMPYVAAEGFNSNVGTRGLRRSFRPPSISTRNDLAPGGSMPRYRQPNRY